ncbi:MAG: hypothetical protein SNJ56_02015, partial [Termitinemataceae bacterium]
MFEDIEAFIQNYGIVTAFQPIVSVNRKVIVGFEALSRGTRCPIDSETDPVFVPYAELYQRASQNNQLHELDRACTLKALQTWKEFRRVFTRE